MSFLRALSRCPPGLIVGSGCTRWARVRCASTGVLGIGGFGEFGVSIASSEFCDCEFCACIVGCVCCVI